jgi:hypothetical protein
VVRRRASLLLSLFTVPGLAACMNGHEPGEELGTFSVVAELASSTCGKGALGATDPWKFEIKLARFERELFWRNGREDITGTLEADGVSFRFDTRVEAEVVPAQRGTKACVISRKDHAEGRLSSPDDDVVSFEGSLDFEFSAVDGSDCSSVIGVPGGFEKLPCRMTYDPIEGTRTKAPE